jgi:uncharacterized protein (TIGR03083 family)
MASKTSMSGNPRVGAMDTATSYASTRVALLALGRTLTTEQTALPVPALPGWTVRDTYAHLGGGCADVLDDNLEGAGSDSWTASQVAARADVPFEIVLEEWEARGPSLDAWISAAPPSRSMFLALDAWSHEQDIRAAVGRRGTRDDERVAFLAAISREVFDRRFRDAAAPALRLHEPNGEFMLGDGAAQITLRVDDYELMRMLFGRRSHAQMLAADWDGDPTPLLDHLHLFPLPEIDLAD